MSAFGIMRLLLTTNRRGSWRLRFGRSSYNPPLAARTPSEVALAHQVQADVRELLASDQFSRSEQLSGLPPLRSSRRLRMHGNAGFINSHRMSRGSCPKMAGADRNIMVVKWQPEE